MGNERSIYYKVYMVESFIGLIHLKHSFEVIHELTTHPYILLPVIN